MSSYCLAFPLPSSVKKQIARLCYGLPQINWVEEENFHLIIRHFGSPSFIQLQLIKERLSSLFFHPFSVVLQGIEYSQTKAKRGTLRINIQLSVEWIQLQKQINILLKDLSLNKNDEHSYVLLGQGERLSADKLGDYLSSHFFYQSQPIEMTSCTLFCIRTTSKSVFFESIETYLASPQETGED